MPLYLEIWGKVPPELPSNSVKKLAGPLGENQGKVLEFGPHFNQHPPFLLFRDLSPGVTGFYGRAA